MAPTEAGFLQFIRDQMKVPVSALPDNAPIIHVCYCVSLEIVNVDFRAFPHIYEQMVYNLGGDNLLNFAQDVAGSNFFEAARKQYNLNSFVAGVISGAADEGTSETILNPDFMKNLTLADLQNLRTPYGRAYLAYAQKYGSIWGIS